MKYIKNYATKAAYDSDATRPTDSSVASNIQGGKVIYAGKNVFVTKEASDVGDMVGIEDGVLKYIKLDTYDATLTTLRPFGVVYHRTNDQVRILHKDDLGTQMWAAPFRAKIEGLNLLLGGSCTITVNTSTYPFTISAGATMAQVGASILAALPSGAGWTVEVKTDYIVVQRSFYTPAITTFEVTGATGRILNTDQQCRLSDLVTPYGNISRRNGYGHLYAGGNFEKFLAYYSVSGSEDRNVGIGQYGVVRRSVFTLADNATLFVAYASYEDYILDNMVKYPYSKNAIIDRNGKKNTALLAAATYTDDDGVKKPQFPAASRAKEMVNAELAWWLPTVEELSLLMLKAGVSTDPINRSLASIGGGIVRNTTHHWSSSEYSPYLAWFYYGRYGGILRNSKNISYAVRAVSAF